MFPRVLILKNNNFLQIHMVKGIFNFIYLVTFRWPRFFKRRRTQSRTVSDSPSPSMECKFFCLRTSVSLSSLSRWPFYLEIKWNKNLCEWKGWTELLSKLGNNLALKFKTRWLKQQDCRYFFGCNSKPKRAKCVVCECSQRTECL